MEFISYFRLPTSHTTVHAGYFYGGLCFSGTAMSEYKSSESYKTEFRLIDNKDTDDTRDDVAYHYVASHIYGRTRVHTS